MGTFDIRVQKAGPTSAPTLPALEAAPQRHAPKVVHVVLSLQPGGLERLVCDLSLSTSRSGNDVLVCCLDVDGKLSASLRRAGIGVHVVKRRPGLDALLVLRLARFFRRERVGVVHTHGLDPMLYAGWAARLAGVPVRIHTQHDTMLEAADWRRRLKFRIAARAFHKIVAVSARTHDIVSAHHHAAEQVMTIANGIDERRFAATAPQGGLPVLPGESRDLVIGTVARLAPEKGLNRLIDAFAIVRQTRPRVRLMIVGDGPERGQLEAQVDRLGIRPAVSFLGYRDNVEHVVRQFDLFVLSSLTEGIPLALLEAMAAGIPPVATAVGGVPEVVVDAESGLLVPPGDPRALLHAIVDLLDHPEKRATLGTNAAARIRDKFSLSRMAADYRKLYRQDDGARWWAGPMRLALSSALPRTLVIWHGPRSRAEIALTLDDGPDPTYTPQLLSVLKAHRVRATFFLIGDKAARHPELVERIAADGHQLANHSYRHPDFGTLSWSAAREEILATRRVLHDIEPSATAQLFRPPRGTMCAASTVVPWMQGHTVVLWNVDFKDFLADTAADITDRLDQRRLASGDIILFHGHNPAALEALPFVLRSAQRAGLAFVPASRMCER
jgi:sugar transferase (PEP-CTERM/EpsH1 system associated)